MKATNPTQVHSSIGAREVAAFGLDANDFKSGAIIGQLESLGIHFGEANLNQMLAAMDSIQPTVTTGSIGTPIQFLQFWAPGFVNVITQVRNADELMGVDTVGTFADEEIVQGVQEFTGKAQPYGDVNNIPFASWNTNFERRTIIRFEQGFSVNRLEEQRAAAMRVSSADNKRNSAALSLEIQRNAVGFYGYNNGDNRTYGFLNDANLPNYVNVANPGSGTTWAVKTFLQICADIRTAVAALLTRSGGNVDAMKVPTTLAVAQAAVTYLTTVSDFGISVRDWLKQSFPQMRIVSAPELDAANGSANVFYLYADKVTDGSTDNGAVWAQNVPNRSYMLGIHQTAKGYVEDYANATAGAMLKRPYAVVRYSGI